MKGRYVMLRTFCRRMIVVPVVATSFAGAAAGAGAMTATVGTPDLSAKVLITVPVAVSCSPFSSAVTLFAESVSVQIEQSAGQAIARGSGGTFSFLPTLLFPCDDIERTVSVDVLADPDGPPFHGGQAVLTGSASAEAGTPCFPGSTTCFTSPFEPQSVQLGPKVVHLH
jgi:hypothetical protein